MVKVDKDVYGNPLPCSIYLDGKEKQILDLLHQRRVKDWDGVGCIVGSEGDGKTVMVYKEHYICGVIFQ